MFNIYNEKSLFSFIDILIDLNHEFDTIKPEIQKEFPKLSDNNIEKILLTYFIERDGVKKFNT